MLTIEKTVLPSPDQWEIIIEGMRNPMNSWDKSDSRFDLFSCDIALGEADHQLMGSLAKGGAVHAKYRRMIPVFLTINAPLYWWKEFDTYKVGTVANSCSTMHKIHAKEFTLGDFSCEHLMNSSLKNLESTILALNYARHLYVHGHKGVPGDDSRDVKPHDKKYWWQMIQLLPTSYNQKRTVMLNYEVLVNIYHSRKNHKLDEWHTFCDWIRGLPYSELITGGDSDA